MLARLPEQQCNNVELFELFSEFSETTLRGRRGGTSIAPNSPSATVLVGTVEECASQSDRLKVVFYKVGIT